MYIIKTLLEYFVYIYLFTALFLYIAQELIIFPRIITSKLSRKVFDENRPPKGIESFFAKTADGEDIEIWTNHKKGDDIQMAGIIFHGNGETVETLNYVSFFEQVGIKSFTFDYRGTGLSSGWPSEKGLYLDAEGVYKAIIERTGLKSENIILLGNSIGSGPASYLASKIKPRGLILLSAYSDIKSVARRRLYYRLFAYAVRYYMPTFEYIKNIGNAFVILAHGRKDSIIRINHLSVLKNNVPKHVKLSVIESETAGHNDLYDTIRKDLVIKTKELISST